MADEVFCQCHFDQISATYHAFWQIFSKKCEIIENRKKLPKMANIVRECKQLTILPFLC